MQVLQKKMLGAECFFGSLWCVFLSLSGCCKSLDWSGDALDSAVALDTIWIVYICLPLFTKEDKQLIFGAVDHAGGFDAINSKLKREIREAIAIVANQFGKDLENLHVQLGRQRANVRQLAL